MVLLVRMGNIKEGVGLKKTKDKFSFRFVMEIIRNLFWFDIRKIFLIFRFV